MSKTSTGIPAEAEEKTVETESTVETVTTVQQDASTTGKPVQKEKKHTVYRFLELKPQPTGYGTLLIKHYGQQIHTISEWENLMQTILNRKVQ